jgi:hypothetical protein
MRCDARGRVAAGPARPLRHRQHDATPRHTRRKHRPHGRNTMRGQLSTGPTGACRSRTRTSSTGRTSRKRAPLAPSALATGRSRSAARKPGPAQPSGLSPLPAKFPETSDPCGRRRLRTGLSRARRRRPFSSIRRRVRSFYALRFAFARLSILFRSCRFGLWFYDASERERIAQARPPPPPPLDAHTHARARTHTHTHSLTHSLS